MQKIFVNYELQLGVFELWDEDFRTNCNDFFTCDVPYGLGFLSCAFECFYIGLNDYP
jgi:hypothetical protein